MINHQLEKSLINIRFVEKFNKIYERYPYTGNELKKVNPKILVEYLNSGKYYCKYDLADEFFNMKPLKKNIFDASVNFTTKYGVAQFILNVTINGGGTGGPFTMLSLCGGKEKRVPDPRFSSLDDLKKILIGLLSLYDEIIQDLTSKEC